MKEDIFKFLIHHALMPSYTCGIPLPSTYLSTKFNISQYKCKRILHELRDEGLIEVIRGGYYDDWYGKNYLYCGWYITEKAKITDIYKHEEQRIDEILRENNL